MPPRKKRPRRDVNWSFRLLVVFVLLLALGGTGYRYGVEPLRERQRRGWEEVEKPALLAAQEQELRELREEMEESLADLQHDLTLLQMEHRNLRATLESGSAPEWTPPSDAPTAPEEL